MAKKRAGAGLLKHLTVSRFDNRRRSLADQETAPDLKVPQAVFQVLWVFQSVP